MLRRITKFLIKTVAILLILLLGSYFIVNYLSRPSFPPIPECDITNEKVQFDDDIRQVKSNWLRQDDTGIWELYLEGNAYERGFAAGAMSPDLLYFQEAQFAKQLAGFVEGRIKQEAFLTLAKFFNRGLPDHVPLEIKQEIFGISRFAPDTFDFIGEKYQRKLNFHAAHDIGHAFQNMGLVSGCSAAADLGSDDGKILLGRNFDFYVGDGFAKNKVVMCVRPDDGFPFLSLSWPGMMGVVSAMNNQGLAVALNAGPSQPPDGCKTPVSILAREIVQYAANIEQAIEIAEKRDVFVSENFLIASAKDNRAIVIEKSPGSTRVLEMTSQPLVCTNHFQTEANFNSSTNEGAIVNTSTQYRFDRIKNLLSRDSTFTINSILGILRDKNGINNQILGLGNEMAVNQLNGHHSIVFHPYSGSVYIAAVPDQCGPVLRYQLDSIFDSRFKTPQRLWLDSLPADPFYKSDEWRCFQEYKSIRSNLETALKKAYTFPRSQLERLINLNPDSYEAYMLAGQYYSENGNCQLAKQHLNRALSMPVAWNAEKEEIERMLNNCQSEE